MTSEPPSIVLVEKPIVPRRSLRRTVAASSVVLITLGSLEGLVRMWGYSRPQIYDPIYRPFEKTDEIPYIHKANLIQARARGLAIISTDGLGLRTTGGGRVPGPKPPGEYRIALVGDSVTFGEGVERTENTFAQVLERTLNRGQPATARVLNFGASAYSVKEMALTLQYRILDIQPDLAVMAIIPADFDLARTPAIDGTGYLIDRRLSRFNPADSMTRRALRGLHLAYVLRDAGVRWFFKPAADFRQALSEGQIPESYRYLREFKSTAEQNRLSYVIALLPGPPGKVWGALPGQLERDRVRHVDLSFLSSEFSEEEYRASRFDPHPSSAVHRRIGEALAAYVREESLIGTR